MAIGATEPASAGTGEDGRVREHTAALERVSLLGLRERYPGDTEDELRARAAALRFGRDLFARLSGRTFVW